MCEGKMKFRKGKHEATVLPVLEFPALVTANARYIYIYISETR